MLPHLNVHLLQGVLNCLACVPGQQHVLAAGLHTRKTAAGQQHVLAAKHVQHLLTVVDPDFDSEKTLDVLGRHGGAPGWWYHQRRAPPSGGQTCPASSVYR